MSYFIQEVLRPKVRSCFGENSTLEVNFGIGVTTGSVLVARVGMQGGDRNDLVWVGDSVNMAVKLSAYSKESDNLKNQNYVFISEEVFEKLPDSLKQKARNGGIGFLFATSVWSPVYPPRSEGIGLIRMENIQLNIILSLIQKN